MKYLSGSLQIYSLSKRKNRNGLASFLIYSLKLYGKTVKPRDKILSILYRYFYLPKIKHNFTFLVLG
jgi:hypothetical protein